VDFLCDLGDCFIESFVVVVGPVYFVDNED